MGNGIARGELRMRTSIFTLLSRNYRTVNKVNTLHSFCVIFFTYKLLCIIPVVTLVVHSVEKFIAVSCRFLLVSKFCRLLACNRR